MARRKQDQKRNPLDVNLNLSSLDSPFRTISNISAAAGVLATLFCIGGVVIWFYVLGRSDEISHKILVVADGWSYEICHLPGDCRIDGGIANNGNLCDHVGNYGFIWR